MLIGWRHLEAQLLHSAGAAARQCLVLVLLVWLARQLSAGAVAVAVGAAAVVIVAAVACVAVLHRMQRLHLRALELLLSRDNC